MFYRWYEVGKHTMQEFNQSLESKYYRLKTCVWIIGRKGIRTYLSKNCVGDA